MSVEANNSGASATGLSPEEFLQLGQDAVALIRPVSTKAGVIYGIFSATGEHLGTAQNRATARAAAIQHNLHPVDLH
jgi:hypothetical protein